MAVVREWIWPPSPNSSSLTLRWTPSTFPSRTDDEYSTQQSVVCMNGPHPLMPSRAVANVRLSCSVIFRNKDFSAALENFTYCVLSRAGQLRAKGSCDQYIQKKICISFGGRSCGRQAITGWPSAAVAPLSSNGYKPRWLPQPRSAVRRITFSKPSPAGGHRRPARLASLWSV